MRGKRRQAVGSRGQIRLEVLPHRARLWPCRFTNFIVGSAGRIANCWCAARNGRARLARTAARRKFPRSCRSSPRARRAVRNRFARENRVPAACAAPANRTRTEAELAQPPVNLERVLAVDREWNREWDRLVARWDPLPVHLTGCLSGGSVFCYETSKACRCLRA